MKVHELIAILSELDPELPAVIRGFEGGINEIEKVELIKIMLNFYGDVKPNYYGQHEKVWDSNHPQDLEEMKKYQIVNAVLIKYLTRRYDD